MPTVAPLQPSVRSRRRRFGLLGTAGWLCLMGMGSSQSSLHASSAAPSVPCVIQQKTPLYVGFADSMGLDMFEQTALESREILREVKHWACDESTDTSAAVPSLQLAFAKAEPMRLDRLQFDDPALARAHVLLSDAKTLFWRIDLAHTDEQGWAVTRTGIASARDLADPEARR
jgi:hypothetical protein